MLDAVWKAFGEDLYDTLDVMENLVDSIEQDKLLTEGIRGWVKRLELTLNKLATKDPKFLDHDAPAGIAEGKREAGHDDDDHRNDLSNRSLD